MRKPFFTIILSLVVLSAVNGWLSFFVYENSFQLVLFFFILFIITALFSSDIRHFLTLPETFWANATVRIILFSILFLIVNTFIGGVEVLELKLTSTTFFGIISLVETTLSPLVSAIIGSAITGGLIESIIYFSEQ